MARFLPWTMVVLSVGASMLYGLEGDWRRMTYWAAAAILTASVTW